MTRDLAALLERLPDFKAKRLSPTRLKWQAWYEALSPQRKQELRDKFNANRRANRRKSEAARLKDNERRKKWEASLSDEEFEERRLRHNKLRRIRYRKNAELRAKRAAASKAWREKQKLLRGGR